MQLVEAVGLDALRVFSLPIFLGFFCRVRPAACWLLLLSLLAAAAAAAAAALLKAIVRVYTYSCSLKLWRFLSHIAFQRVAALLSFSP